MSTSGVNVLRYSALGFGIFYGFWHQRTIKKTQATEAARREYDHKAKLIEQARSEYTRLKAPPQPSGVVADPMDPKFDLESYFSSLMKENQ